MPVQLSLPKILALAELSEVSGFEPEDEFASRLKTLSWIAVC